jgi:O-antigen chain-terminating methyltransferase
MNERLNYVRAEIAQDLDDSEGSIMREFLDDQERLDIATKNAATTDSDGQSDAPSPAHSIFESIQLDPMIESRNRNNHIYQVDYEKPAEASTSVVGAIKNRIKQKIRRIIAPVIAPLVLEQNTFNASVTTSINLLSDNQYKIAEFIKQQEEENRALRSKVSALSNEVDRLRAENAAARLEIIRSRKRLHREMQLVLEEVDRN